jgi:hypothetical protein
MKFRDES